MTQTAELEHPPAGQALSCLEVWGGNEPVDTALRVPGLDVWVYAVPFQNAAAGGDVHYVSSCGTGRIARLMIADVAGHGSHVADTARTLRTIIRRFMNHIDQRKCVMAMNRQFTAMSQTGRFATAVMMTYFCPTRELTLCNAGHPHPILYQAATKTWRYLNEDLASRGNAKPHGAPPEESLIENYPLGIDAAAAYEQFRTILQPGDLVLTYSDSLIEAECRDTTLLGEERLLTLLNAIPLQTPEAPAHLIHHLLAKFAVFGASLNDDVTIMVTRCHGPAKGADFAKRLIGQLKFIGQVLTFQKSIPWPEWSWKNVGGAVVPKMSQHQSK